MSNPQNIYQNNFGDIGTKIAEKNPQFGPHIDPYMGGGSEINTKFKFLRGIIEDKSFKISLIA
jgi:hypothetical protein